MDLHLPDGPGSLPERIYAAVLDMVADGRLRPGDPLPPSRTLARQLGVSRTSVTSAYERLAGEGYTAGRVGSGTVVADRAPVSAPDASPSSPPPHAPLRAPSEPDGGLVADFRLGSPDPTLFPYPGWRRAILDAIRPARAPEALHGDPQGDPRLRTVLARHLATSRSVVATPDRIVITAGVQQALTILARIAARPGDTVAMESPGYFMAPPAFAATGLTVAHVPLDAEGLIVDALPSDARLVYVTPSHQQPTAVTMSQARRAALLAWAEDHDALIVEDDYDSEFRYVGRPLEPLQRRDSTGRVAYDGSFSKSMLPGLRVGYAVLPERLVEPAVTARDVLDRHGDMTTQAALATFIDRGDYAKHLRRSRRHYWRRRDSLLAALAGVEGLAAAEPAAGLHLRAHLPGAEPGAAARISAACAEHGVLVEPLGEGARWPSPPGTAESLLVGFGCLRDADIERGVAEVARAVRDS